jgi:3D (Asp-Asp-Asp) domain-containing protein
MSQRITPTLSEFTRVAIESYFERHFTALVCKVESYNETLQEADLKPVSLVKVYSPDGELIEEELPVLASVPVAFPRAGDWFVSWPVTAGDTMTVIISSRDFSDWREKGQDIVAEDVRVNPLNAAIAIPNNIYTKSAALQNVHASKMVVGKDTGARIYIADDQIDIYEENAQEFVALGQKADDRFTNIENKLNDLISKYNSLVASVTSHTHGGVQAGGSTTSAAVSGTSESALGAQNSVQAAKVKAT